MKQILLTTLCALLLSNVQAQSSIAVGATCPDFTITDTKGQTHNLYSYCDAGKYVLVDFFAYWCGPCVSTAPFIDAFYKKYGCNAGNVVVLGNESDATSTLANLQSFDQQAGLDANYTYPVWLGSNGGNANMSAYGIAAYPTIVLIGPDKKMINSDVWPISSIANLEAAFPSGALSPLPCIPASVSDIADLENNTIIYPNPTSDVLSIKSLNIHHVNIFNQVGQTMFSQSFDNTNYATIDVRNLASGIYYLELTAKKGTIVKSITIR
jgi:thiol-disulfide isomerase/thioredoxin